jgi:GNAT superfamily N-acetyltransferase
MEAVALREPAHPLPSPEIRPVADAATRADFNHLMSVAFGVPFSISRQIYDSESTWRAGMKGHVAYLDGAPVATTATVAAAGVIGVYAVATLPEHRRRGFGEVVMRHALECARGETGLTRSVLQSSDAGYSLYQKMGYRTVATYSVFATR